MNARWIYLLLVLPALVAMLQGGNNFVRAEEDEVENDDDGAVEDEDNEEATEGTPEDEEDESAKKFVHPDADTFLQFTRPTTVPGAVELPAGKIVEFLVGFTNKADQEFQVEYLDASFRYPMDFTFHIQNFSAIAYHKTVKPKEQATVAYSFIPADAFAGRPIGLTVNLHYKDLDGNLYFDPVFNETVQIVEFDEGFDTEVFFMYVFIAAGGLLLLFLVFTFATGSSKKKGTAPSAKPVETGTANDDVDYEWIPRSALRTPGSGKTSPRQRKSKRNAGSDTD